MITRLLNSHHTTLSFPHHTSYFTPRATIRAILQPFNTYLLIHALQTLVHYSLYFNKLISNRSQQLRHMVLCAHFLVYNIDEEMAGNYLKYSRRIQKNR